MILCPYCQTQNPDGGAFCTGCGQALGAQPGGFARPAERQKSGLAIAALVLGVLSLPGVFCFGIGYLLAVVGVVLGAIAMRKASREPSEYGGKGMAIAGVAVGGMALLTLPLVLLIAIPSMLRAKVSANESATIGDIRTVISAQAAYQAANGGFYEGSMNCLPRPGGCIPNAPAGAPTFLDPVLASLADKSGYKREFHPGPEAGGDTTQISPSSVATYAYTAVPVNQGRSGVRSFCGDSSGVICVNSEGGQPAVSAGECAQPCTALR